MKMHICMLTESYPSVHEGKYDDFALYRGTAVHNTTKGLIKQGIDVDVITSKTIHEPNFEIYDGVKVHRVKKSKSKFYPILFIFRMIKKCAEIHKKHKIDIVHGQWANFAGLAAVLFSKKYKIPSVITIKGNDIAYSKKDNYGAYGNIILRNIVRYNLKNVNKIISLSYFLNEQLKKIWKCNRETTIIPIGPGNYFFNTPIPKNKNKIFTILSVTRIIKRKRLQDVIDALAILKKKGIKIKYYIVGMKGDYYTELVKKIKKYDLKDIIFTGAMKNKEVMKYYDKCDLFILPSIAEGLGNVFIEALARKKPIILTPNTGFSNFLKNKENAIIIPPFRPNKIAEGIELLIRDKRLTKKIANKGYNLVKKKFNYEIIAKKTIKVYDNLFKLKYNYQENG